MPQIVRQASLNMSVFRINDPYRKKFTFFLKRLMMTPNQELCTSFSFIRNCHSNPKCCIALIGKFGLSSTFCSRWNFHHSSLFKMPSGSIQDCRSYFWKTHFGRSKYNCFCIQNSEASSWRPRVPAVLLLIVLLDGCVPAGWAVRKRFTCYDMSLVATGRFTWQSQYVPYS